MEYLLCVGLVKYPRASSPARKMSLFPSLITPLLLYPKPKLWQLEFTQLYLSTCDNYGSMAVRIYSVIPIYLDNYGS